MHKEQRKFRADENLVLQVIKRQAGTLAKAVLEGVMNSVDAGAAVIDVTLTSGVMTITDNGKGFASAKDIEQVFEVFGHPHELDANGVSVDAKYGTFRIGRGQLFAFGRNTWRTNTFCMETDINTMGLNYTLQQKLPKQAGCSVTVHLYDTLDAHARDTVIDDITRLCRYIPQKLILNGKAINMDPATQKWDIVHDLAYIRKTVAANRWSADAGLEIYQQGVFVENIPAREFGLEGTVVIRQGVQLNFARNQVIRSCSLWKKITALLRETGLKEAAKKARLSKHEANMYVRAFASGDVTDDKFRSIACLPDTNGRLWSLERLEQIARSSSTSASFHAVAGQVQVGFGQSGCRKADAVMQRKLALVLDDNVRNWFDASPQVVIDRFNESVPRRTVLRERSDFLKLVDYTKLLDAGDDHAILPEQALTPKERLVLDVMQRNSHCLCSGARNGSREIHIGTSTTALGWTDGATYIAVARDYLKTLNLALERDWHKLSVLLIHESCHMEPDSGTHNHTPDFYEDFHETVFNTGAELGRKMFLANYKLLNNLTRKNKAVRNHVNLEAEAYVLTQLTAQ